MQAEQLRLSQLGPEPAALSQIEDQPFEFGIELGSR
jgi:hypothetical protein